MPKASRDSLNAKGKTDVWYLDPNDAVLVTDKSSALYDERVHSDYREDLVLNMMYAPDDEVPLGVLKACIGRRNTETGKVEITDGRQRTLALREANKRLKKQGRPPLRLPVWIRRGNDSRQMAMMISANGFATAESVENRVKKAQRYIELGHDESEVAVMIGASVATVKNLLRLQDAPNAIRNAAFTGKITAAAAYQLAREEPADAKKKLGELLEHAPRTPGKKRSKNAKKARAIVDGGKSTTVPAAPAREDWDTRKVEDRAAAAIAAWIERTWNDETWSGSVKEIPEMIRAGDWREKAKAAE